MTVVLLVQGRAKMTLLPSVTSVLLDHIALDT